MDEYTYEDIIMDPEDPRLEGAIGKECYFSDYPKKLLSSAIYNSPEYLDCLTDIRKEGACTFVDKNGSGWTLIIIKKEEPYSERAKKWIKENDLKVNDYVKVTRKTEPYENKWRSFWVDEMSDYIGKALKVLAINSLRGLISLECDDAVYDFPYFVLEKAEKPEPKYVPFESKEEFIEAFHHHDNSKYSETDDILLNYGMWLKSMCLGNFYQVTIIKKSGIFTDDNSSIVTWEQLLEKYTFLDNSPCGKEVKE